jgi:hypothetical protein
MPWADISYGNSLPPQVARGVIWHERFHGLRAVFDSIDGRDFDWIDGTPLKEAVHPDGFETLPSTLASQIGGSKSERRIALVALDSFGPEKDWNDILPVLSSCYDTMVGIFHLERRGLRHHEARFPVEQWLESPSRFCDAVIVTSPALVEADLHVSPSASKEELVGRLTRHLGCALLNPAVSERLVGMGQKGTGPKPRFFALSSLSLETRNDYDLYWMLLITRQADLVWGGGRLGAYIPGAPILHVATAAEDLRSGLVDELRRWLPGSFLTAAVPAATFEKRNCPGLNSLRMITLWPFQLDQIRQRRLLLRGPFDFSRAWSKS